MDASAIERSSPAAAALATALLGACAQLPADLQPRNGEHAELAVHATGVQIYACRVSAADPTRHDWALVAPEAELVDAGARRMGRHYAGPTWEALDGSRITGTVVARAPAPSAGAIPWLLLATRADGTAGVFSRITAVQRLDTVGGVAPSQGCGPADAGTTVRVPYAARYVFLAR